MIFAYPVAFMIPALWSACNVLDQKIAGKLHITSIMLLNSLMVLLIILPLFILLFSPTLPVSKEQIFILFIIGMCDLLYVLPYSAALRLENTSVIAALFELGLVLLPVLSFLMVDEKLTPFQYTGFFVVVLASIMVSTKPQRHFHIGPAFWLMLTSAFISCLGIVLGKYATLQMEWDTVYAGAQFFSASTFLLMGLFPKVRRVFFYEIKKHPETLRYVATEQTICAGAEASTYYAISQLPVTTVKAIGALQPFYVLIFAWLLRHRLKDFFQESLEKRAVRRKILYFTLITIGLWLVIFGAK